VTVIAALVAPDGSVWMGADSVSQRNGTSLELPAAQAKVFSMRGTLVAVSGHARVGAHIRHGFQWPAIGADDDAAAWALTVLAPALRDHLRSVGAYDDERQTEDSGGYVRGVMGSLLIAAHGRIFEMDQELHPTEIGARYHAVGNGEDVALGALRVLTEYLPSMDPRIAIEAALEAACAHREGCAPPFVILQCEDTRTPRLREIQEPAVRGSSITPEQARDAFRRVRSA
jgi:hypothetical protein